MQGVQIVGGPGLYPGLPAAYTGGSLMTQNQGWIVIPGWEKFQHRDAGRSGRGLTWLRDYADQGNKDEFRDLSFHLRGLVRELRHAYASTQGQLRVDTISMGRRFGQRVTTQDIERLVDAGFIEVSASKPPALSQQPASLEVEVEVEPQTPKEVPAKANPNGSRPDNVCPHCGVQKQGPLSLEEHIANVHYDLG